MRPNVWSFPCTYVLLDKLPVFSMEPQRLQESFVLFIWPAPRFDLHRHGICRSWDTAWAILFESLLIWSALRLCSLWVLPFDFLELVYWVAHSVWFISLKVILIAMTRVLIPIQIYPTFSILLHLLSQNIDVKMWFLLKLIHILTTSKGVHIFLILVILRETFHFYLMLIK